jgi:hypothetical protein
LLQEKTCKLNTYFKTIAWPDQKTPTPYPPPDQKIMSGAWQRRRNSIKYTSVPVIPQTKLSNSTAEPFSLSFLNPHIGFPPPISKAVISAPRHNRIQNNRGQ